MSVSSHNSGGRGAIKQSPPNDPSSIIFFLQRKLPPSSCSPSTVSASPFSRRKFSPSLAARHGKISKRHYMPVGMPEPLGIIVVDLKRCCMGDSSACHRLRAASEGAKAML